MNDLKELRKYMNDYKETSKELCDMLDEYLGCTCGAHEECLNEKEQKHHNAHLPQNSFSKD